MKKNNTKLIVLLITLMLMVCLMGCSNAASQPEETAQPETQVTATEETTEVDESEVPEEEVAEEPEEVAEEPAQPEEVEEPEAEEQEEVEYIKDYGTLDDYMEKLEVNKPAILIYNESEEYIVDMKEGQHYNLKKEDKLIINNTSGAKSVGYNFDLVLSDTDFCFYGDELTLNYSNFEENQEFFYFIRLTDDEDPQRLTCYFNAPTE